VHVLGPRADIEFGEFHHFDLRMACWSHRTTNVKEALTFFRRQMIFYTNAKRRGMPISYYTISKKTVFLVTLFWLLGNVTTTVLAQQPIPPVGRLEQATHLTLKGVSFPAALETILHETHIAIVADGVPADKTMDIDVKGSLREVLNRVADEFDYTWRESSGGVILMNKRFKDSKAAPQIHLSEIRQVTKNILMIVQTLSPETNGVDWPELELSLANTFTPEQTRLLIQGERLNASVLSPPQVQDLRTIIGSATFGMECIQWPELLRAFDTMQRSELVVSVINGHKFFAVHDPLTDKNVPQGINIGGVEFTKKKL
jgi:hypothetical protein